jgi:hypothetical protein
MLTIMNQTWNLLTPPNKKINICYINIMKLDSLYLLISLFIGFFIIYTLSPEPKIVIKTPNKDNVNNTLFIDDNNVCYRYTVKPINCKKI